MTIEMFGIILALVSSLVCVAAIGIGLMDGIDPEATSDTPMPLVLMVGGQLMNMMKGGQMFSSLLMIGVAAYIMGDTLVAFLVGCGIAVGFHYVMVLLLKGFRTPAVAGEIAVVLWAMILWN